MENGTDEDRLGNRIHEIQNRIELDSAEDAKNIRRVKNSVQMLHDLLDSSLERFVADYRDRCRDRRQQVDRVNDALLKAMETGERISAQQTGDLNRRLDRADVFDVHDSAEHKRLADLLRDAQLFFVQTTNCRPSDVHVELVAAGDSSTVTLQLRSKKPYSAELLEAELDVSVQRADGTNVPCRRHSQREDAWPTIQVDAAQTAGPLTVNVLLYDQHVANSPFRCDASVSVAAAPINVSRPPPPPPATVTNVTRPQQQQSRGFGGLGVPLAPTVVTNGHAPAGPSQPPAAAPPYGAPPPAEHHMVNLLQEGLKGLGFGSVSNGALVDDVEYLDDEDRDCVSPDTNTASTTGNFRSISSEEQHSFATAASTSLQSGAAEDAVVPHSLGPPSTVTPPSPAVTVINAAAAPTPLVEVAVTRSLCEQHVLARPDLAMLYARGASRGVRAVAFMRVGVVQQPAQALHTAPGSLDIRQYYNQPIGCAVNGVDQRWAFCDSGNHVVKVYSCEFGPLHMINYDMDRGTTMGLLKKPSAVAFLPFHKLMAVKDDWGILLFDMDSYRLYPGSPTQNHTFKVPSTYGLCAAYVDNRECLITLGNAFDGTNANIMFLNVRGGAGQPLINRQVAYPGRIPGSKPRFIDWHPAGLLAISDLGTHAVYVLSCPECVVLHTLGVVNEPGNDLLHLNFPGGVVFDGRANLLVGDCRNNRIQLFTRDRSTGAYECADSVVMATEQGVSKQFVFMSDIALGANAQLAVMAKKQQYVQMFQLGPLA